MIDPRTCGVGERWTAESKAFNSAALSSTLPYHLLSSPPSPSLLLSYLPHASSPIKSSCRRPHTTTAPASLLDFGPPSLSPPSHTMSAATAAAQVEQVRCTAHPLHTCAVQPASSRMHRLRRPRLVRFFPPVYSRCLPAISSSSPSPQLCPRLVPQRLPSAPLAHLLAPSRSSRRMCIPPRCPHSLHCVASYPTRCRLPLFP